MWSLFWGLVVHLYSIRWKLYVDYFILYLDCAYRPHEKVQELVFSFNLVNFQKILINFHFVFFNIDGFPPAGISNFDFTVCSRSLFRFLLVTLDWFLLFQFLLVSSLSFWGFLNQVFYSVVCHFLNGLAHCSNWRHFGSVHAFQKL